MKKYIYRSIKNCECSGILICSCANNDDGCDGAGTDTVAFEDDFHCDAHCEVCGKKARIVRALWPS